MFSFINFIQFKVESPEKNNPKSSKFDDYGGKVVDAAKMRKTW